MDRSSEHAWCVMRQTPCKMSQLAPLHEDMPSGQRPRQSKLVTPTGRKDKVAWAKQSPWLAAIHAHAQLEILYVICGACLKLG